MPIAHFSRIGGYYILILDIIGVMRLWQSKCSCLQKWLIGAVPMIVVKLFRNCGLNLEVKLEIWPFYVNRDRNFKFVHTIELCMGANLLPMITLCCALIILICDTLHLVPRCKASISCAGLANWFNRLCWNTIHYRIVVGENIFILSYYMNWLLDKNKISFY